MAEPLFYYYQRKAQLIKLLGGECVKCGTTKELEFDHIDPTTKAFTVMQGWSLSIEKVLAELEKCQLLCQPCHKEKTEAAYNMQHGTLSMHKHKKCRCDLCRETYNAYMREYKRVWRKKRSGIV